MEDENYLKEQLAMLEAHYNYMWANSYSSKHSPFGHERKEMLADVSKQINIYQRRLDIARTINQTESLMDLYKNMLKEIEIHSNGCYDQNFHDKRDHEHLTKEIIRLEERLVELNKLT